MNFLVDAQLPPALCRWLNDRGHSAEHVFDIGMTGASDSEIADFAETGKLILISKDEDFISLRLPDRFAFVWMRCGNTSKTALFTWIELRWALLERLLTKGERFVELR